MLDFYGAKTSYADLQQLADDMVTLFKDDNHVGNFPALTGYRLVDAIKKYRAETGAGLKDAKDIIEAAILRAKAKKIHEDSYRRFAIIVTRNSGNHQLIKLLNKSEAKTAADAIRSVIDVHSIQLVEILEDL